MLDKREQFYKNLKKKLKEDTTFPTKYMFKFIVPADDSKVKQVEDMFDFTGAVITTNNSKTGKYVSITAVVVMKKAEDVIKKYKEAEKVEGIISL